MVLLDTHAWVWLHDGNPRLGKSKTLEMIESARDTGGVLVSIISVWEIGMLVAKNRLKLRNDVGDWTAAGLDKPGMRLLPMSADQIIVATARELDIPIITADAKILAYSRAGYVKTIEV
jgi:PIN domain nuclease of toxin-antitoxin system